MNIDNIKRDFGVAHYIRLANLQARMKLKSQSNKLTLSYLWWVLEPLLFVLMFYVVFEYLLKRGGEDYFSFLVIGKTVYLWFSKTIISASKGMIENKNIISQRDIPKWIFPIVNILESYYKTSISFAVLFIMLWLNGFPPTVSYIHLIPLSLLMTLLICALSFVGSLLVSFARDFMNLIRISMMGMMFMSGVFWDIKSIEDEHTREILLLYNPLSMIIDAFRDVLMHQVEPSYMLMLPSLFISCLLIGFSLWFISKYNNSISRALFS
ncbi:ABC transporter permease [Vibrio sp. SCSIO 43133]|uniref:ABC transporter permease n=1 Tax=Vibrio sp. SCSIO 43133 TaxID=2802577 RepID=UPI00218BF23C|nr:ABC transporter permease [Vibrio sp. SCSIO 43133]